MSERLFYVLPKGAEHIPCPYCGYGPAEVNGKRYVAAHKNDCELVDKAIVAVSPSEDES